MIEVLGHRFAARVIGVEGPSGAGKSTLLKILAGVQRADRGQVRVGGEIWQDDRVFVPPWRRSVAWVPQDALLFPHLSVRRNLAYGGAGNIDEIARELEIEALLDRYPRHLSGGEKQRVALGRALAAPAGLLLLDEPFSALDPALRDRIRDRVRARSRDRKVVLVSHSPLDGENWVEERVTAPLRPDRACAR